MSTSLTNNLTPEMFNNDKMMEQAYSSWKCSAPAFSPMIISFLAWKIADAPRQRGRMTIYQRKIVESQVDVWILLKPVTACSLPNFLMKRIC